jgi:PadR family transcriptional regulator, regulatory protein PadR
MTDGPVRVTQPLLAVLGALLDARDHELHGWAIMKETGRSGPTIYKLLERLADAKWLTSRWEADAEPGRPRRRYYQLTPHGAASARAIIAERAVRRTPSKFRLAFGGGEA